MRLPFHLSLTSSELQRRVRVRVPHSVGCGICQALALCYMSADGPASAEDAAAAASEVLDLNADAMTVDSQEDGRATVADESKPVVAEASTEPSAGTEAIADEGGGRDPAEDGEKEIVGEAGDADSSARPEADVVIGAGEAVGGMVSTGGDAEVQSDGSDRLAEANASQSTEPEMPEGKTGVTVEHLDGTEASEEPFSDTRPEIIEGETQVEVERVDGTEVAEQPTSDNRIGEGSTEPDGDKSSLQVDHAAQETSEEASRGDDVAPDLNSAVDAIQPVEPEDTCPQPVAEEQGDQGDVAVAEADLVPCIATAEIQVEDTPMAGESTEESHTVAGYSAPLAVNILVSTPEPSEVQSSECPIQVDAPIDLDNRDQERGKERWGTTEKPPSTGDASLPVLADKLADVDQNGDTEVASTMGGPDSSQEAGSDHSITNIDEKIAANGGAFVTDDNSMDKSACLLEEDVSQADSSAGQLLTENKSTEVQHVGSLSDENRNSQPSVVADKDVSVTASADLGTENKPIETDIILTGNKSTEVQHVGSLSDENQNSQPSVVAGKDVSVTESADLGTQNKPIETDIIPLEEMHGQEVNSNKEEADGVILTTDVTKDEGDGVDTDEEARETSIMELLEGDKLGKSSAINPDGADSESRQRASYNLPQKDKKGFSISDLVWGKVKSHPWWPGQIFDPLDASEMALKHQKRDNFLVAYFGDKTFAWCDESKLKPFQACFSQLTNQGTSDAFINAVNSALTEVSRRLEFGISCVCVPEEGISKLKHQKIENAGIREGSSCSVLDKTFGVETFAPDNFLDYVKALAIYPCGGVDRLELVVAKAQLMAFNRLKCHMEFPASIGREGLFENDAVSLPSQRMRLCKSLGELPSPTSTNEEIVIADLCTGKRKKSSLDGGLPKQKNIPEHGRKQKSLSELMDDKNHLDLVNGDETTAEVRAFGKSAAHSSGKKRKKDDSTPHSGKSKRKRLDALGDIEKKTPASDRSFKVGECISRIASKLTGSPSIIKCNGESLKKRGIGIGEPGSQIFDVSLHTPEDTRRTRRGTWKNDSSPEELLSQLCLAAIDPMKGYNFLSAIICFFTEVRELRDSGSLVDKRFEKIKKKRGRKKKSELNDDSKNKLSGRPTSSSPVTDAKPPEKIGKKRGRKKKSESKSDPKTDAIEDSKPDYMADSYWTDRIVCSTTEEKSHSHRRKRKGELLIQSETKKPRPLQESLPLSKMLEVAHHLRISAVSPTANRDSPLEKQAAFFGDKCLEESTPTALLLSFNEPDALPSETNLTRTFSRYGPLKEAETEVLRETNSAKVVFKRRADAEVAFSSAGKYCIFGPALVSYRLRYLPSTLGASPEIRSDGRKDTKALDDVSLKIPAQEEAKGLAQAARDAADECTQAELKELGGDEVKGLDEDEAREFPQEEGRKCTQEEAKEFSQDEVKDLDQDEANELCQEEEKEFAQEEVKDLSQEGGKEFTQAETKELTQEKVKELAEDELKDLVQDEVKELCQAVESELVENEATGLMQEDATELMLDDTTELMQEEAAELIQKEAKELAQSEAKE